MRKFNHLKLNNQLCFAIYAASNSLTRAYRSPLSVHGITFPQYLVMLVLLEEEKSNVKKIADILKVDSATLTPILRRLENRGYVRREKDSFDYRIKYAILTESGMNLGNELSRIQSKIDSLVEIGVENPNNLTDSLFKLIENLNKSNQ